MSGPKKLSSYFLCSIVVVLHMVSCVVGAPASQQDDSSRIVYQRYRKRGPPIYENDLYVDHFKEVFYVRNKPAAHLLSDDDVDRIIRCDFNPKLKECQSLNAASPPLNEVQHTTNVRPVSSTEATKIQTTKTSSTSTRTTSATTRTTSTTTDLPFLPSTTRTTSTTTDLPFLPDIAVPEDETDNEEDAKFPESFGYDENYDETEADAEDEYDTELL